MSYRQQQLEKLADSEKMKNKRQVQEVKKAQKRKIMAALSSSRATSWIQENLNAPKCRLLTDGAARHMNKNGKADFEGGGWKGKRLEEELRYYDQAYNWNYEPDAVKNVQYQLKTLKFNDRFSSAPYDATGQKGGDQN